MCFIKYVCRFDLRMSEAKLVVGDGAVHGELAYCFGENVVGMQGSALEGRVSGRSDIPNQEKTREPDLEMGSGSGEVNSAGRSDKHQERKTDRGHGLKR